MILAAFLFVFFSSIVLVLVDAVLNARGATTWRPALIVQRVANGIYDTVFQLARALTILADIWNGFRRIVMAIRDWVLPFIPLDKLKESLSDFIGAFWIFMRVPLAPFRATVKGILESESPWLTGTVYIAGWLFIPGTWEATVRHMDWHAWIGPVWWLRATYDVLYALGHMLSKLVDLKEFFYGLAAQILVYVPVEIIKGAFKDLYSWAGRIVYESWFLGIRDGLVELGMERSHLVTFSSVLGALWILGVVLFVQCKPNSRGALAGHSDAEADNDNDGSSNDDHAPPEEGSRRIRRRTVVRNSDY